MNFISASFLLPLMTPKNARTHRKVCSIIASLKCTFSVTLSSQPAFSRTPLGPCRKFVASAFRHVPYILYSMSFFLATSYV